MKLFYPRPGWARLTWRNDETIADDVAQNIEKAAEIPGVELYRNWLDISLTSRYLLDVQPLLNGSQPNPYSLLIGTDWGQHTLYDHQHIGAMTIGASVCQGILLADDMGLGKTATAIAAAETYLQKFAHANKVLIVGPSFSREVWRAELLRMGVISKPDDLCVVRTRNIDHASYRPDARWVFIHYEIVYSWRSGLTYEIKHRPDVLIVDEAHWVRNGRAQRSKAVYQIAADAKLRIALTGTPMENRPSDLWHPLSVAAGPGSFGAPLDFRQRYCGAFYTGFGWEDGEPVHMDELQLRLETCYLRRTAADVGLDLPPMQRVRRVVDLRRMERRAHDKVLRKVPLEKLVQAVLEGQFQDVLPILTRLRQVTSTGKLTATAELITDVREQEDAVVVFCWERETARLLNERAAGWLATGDQPIEARNVIVDSFQKHGGTLVATYGALREGVTLHRARIVILHDLTWVLSALLQAERRIHRIGQRRVCQSVWVVGENSFDSVLADALIYKAKLAEEVLGIGEGVAATAEVNLRDLVEEHDFNRRIEEILDNWIQAQ